MQGNITAICEKCQIAHVTRPLAGLISKASNAEHCGGDTLALAGGCGEGGSSWVGFNPHPCPYRPVPCLRARLQGCPQGSPSAHHLNHISRTTPPDSPLNASHSFGGHQFIIRRHLESGPSDRQTAGTATRRAGNRHRAGDLTARPAWLPGGRPFPRERGRRQPGAGSGHRVRLSRTNHTGNRTGLQSSEPLWNGEAPEDAPTCQAAATRLGASGAWDLGGCRPAERFRKRRRVPGVPGQSAMGPQRSPTTGHGLVTSHCLGALPCWGRSAPGWAWGRASALCRRPLLTGYTQPRLVWSSSLAASWLWSSWGCSLPSPAPRASLRISWVLC